MLPISRHGDLESSPYALKPRTEKTSKAAKAGVSHADIIALRVVRNSEVRHAPLYRKIRERVRAQVNAYQAQLLQNSFVTAA